MEIIQAADEATARNLHRQQISAGRGALIVRAGDTAEPRHLLEKIIVGVALPADGTPIPAERLPWKKNSAVILVGEADDFLGAFEQIVPGFNALFSGENG